MRIISGSYKGRKVNPPGSLPVRPTTDFAKEGLFNVLQNMIDFDETDALDLFTGTGNISFEMYSRGCRAVTSVDIEQSCIRFIQKTAVQLKMEHLRAVRSNVFVFIDHIHEQFDLVFADPPYDMPGLDLLPGKILAGNLVRPGGLFIMEHSSRYDFSDHEDFVQVRTYGRVNFSFFRKG